MIKYAVMTFMYDNWVNSDSGSHEELIKIIADSGAEGIEAFANHFIGNDDLVKLYQKEMPNHSVAMPVMDLLANLAQPAGKEREAAYELMRRGIDICDALDTEIVHIAGCSLPKGVTPADGKKLIAEGLADFADEVEQRGMVLAFEDFDPSPELICSAADCLEILNLTDKRVKFVFDTGNFEAVGEHAEENFAKLIGRTTHFHFKDFQQSDLPRGYAGTYFGQGFVKNQTVADLIKECGYSGWVALESYPQVGNGPRETVPKELEVLKAMLS